MRPGPEEEEAAVVVVVDVFRLRWWLGVWTMGPENGQLSSLGAGGAGSGSAVGREEEEEETEVVEVKAEEEEGGKKDVWAGEETTEETIRGMMCRRVALS